MTAEIRLVHGWAFPIADRFMSEQLHPDGSYQSGHLRIALEYVKDWSIAVDAGAHVGTWSKTLSSHFTRVIAAEPAEDTFQCLEMNMRRFECTNVELRNVALGAASGTVHMVLDGRALDLANTGARYMKVGGKIPCEAIDDWHLPSLGFLKLDIEGAELQALTGAALTLARCKPIVLFECKGFGKRYGEQPDAIPKLLTSLGYHQAAVCGCDKVWAAR